MKFLLFAIVNLGKTEKNVPSVCYNVLIAWLSRMFSYLKIVSHPKSLLLIIFRFPTETFSIQDDDLKHLCNLKYHIRDGPHKCRPAVPDFTGTINDESLARLLVRELGPKEALKMLKYFKEEFVPSSQFYYACLQISEKELEQR